jgi:hypothetical protein
LQNRAVLYQKKQEKTVFKRFLCEKSIKKQAFWAHFRQKALKKWEFNAKNGVEMDDFLGRGLNYLRNYSRKVTYEVLKTS